MKDHSPALLEGVMGNSGGILTEFSLWLKLFSVDTNTLLVERPHRECSKEAGGPQVIEWDPCVPCLVENPLKMDQERAE
jgi:hypothetical protein